MISTRHPLQPGDISQRRQTDILSRAHNPEPLPDKSTVQTCQGNNVTNSTQRRKIEQVEKFGFLALARKPASRPQGPVQRNQQQKHYSDRSQLTEPTRIIQPVGVYNRMSRRQCGLCLMVIDDHNIKSLFSRNPKRLMRHRAAINGNDKRNAKFLELHESRCVRAIPFLDPVGDIDTQMRARHFKISFKKCG